MRYGRLVACSLLRKLGSRPREPEKQKTRRKAGCRKNMRNARQLPGWMWDRRSARARGHAGGHARAGQDRNFGRALEHPAKRQMAVWKAE
jgi:hypothetical protein